MRLLRKTRDWTLGRENEGGDAFAIQPQGRPKELRQSKAWSEISSSFPGRVKNLQQDPLKHFQYSADSGSALQRLGLSEWRYNPRAWPVSHQTQAL